MENKKIIIKGLATLNLRKKGLEKAQKIVSDYTAIHKSGMFNGKPLDEDGKHNIAVMINTYNHQIKILKNLIKKEEPLVQKEIDKVRNKK